MSVCVGRYTTVTNKGWIISNQLRRIWRRSRPRRLHGPLVLLALAQQACMASGLADSDRSSPEYAIERYLQPCKTARDCGARQLCLSKHCTCPYVIGLTGAPQCTTISTGGWLLLCWVLLLGALELCLAYLHVVSLRAHWSQSLSPMTSRILPSTASSPSSSSSAPHQPPLPRSLSFCHVLLTFKSLFSLSSLVFCLTPLAFCGTSVAMLLFPRSTDLETIYWSTWAVEILVPLVSLFAVTHAYLFMGELWLDAATRFKLGSFLGTRLSKLLLHLPSLLMLLVILGYSSIGGTPLGLYLTSIAALVVTALLATGFFVLGASIMVPVLQARAQQAKKSGKSRGKAMAGGGVKRVRRGNSVQSASRDHRAVVRWLKSKRNTRFKPELSKISEAESSALEESSSAGYIGNNKDRAEQENAAGGKGPQARLMGSFKGSFVAVDRNGQTLGSQRNLAADTVQRKEEEAEVEEGGVTVRRLQATDYESLAWHVALTAIKVSGALVAPVCAYVCGCLLLRYAHSQGQDPFLGALSTMLWYLSFPLCHLYANLLCLLIISKEARDAIRPLQWTLACVGGCVCGLLLCGGAEGNEEEEEEEEEEGGEEGGEGEEGGRGQGTAAGLV